MSSDTVTALQNALSDIAQEQQQNNRKVSQCQVEADRAKVSLQDAEQRETTALYEQRLIENDLKALLALYNNAVDTPHELRPRINKLTGDQVKAAQRSEAASETVTMQKQVLHEVDVRLGIALEVGKEITARQQKVYALLQQEINK